MHIGQRHTEAARFACRAGGLEAWGAGDDDEARNIATVHIGWGAELRRVGARAFTFGLRRLTCRCCTNSVLRLSAYLPE